MQQLTRDIIFLAGGPSVVAERLGLTRQAVSAWGKVPATHVLVVEEMSGISRYDIRPDVYGPRPKKARTRGASVAA